MQNGMESFFLGASKTNTAHFFLNQFDNTFGEHVFSSRVLFILALSSLPGIVLSGLSLRRPKIPSLNCLRYFYAPGDYPYRLKVGQKLVELYSKS